MRADAEMRAMYGNVPAPEFETTAFVVPPPLREARVAVVTTAALQHPHDEHWDAEGASFRVFERDDRDLIVGHVSVNFDRTGIAADLNVAYPLDRLEELEDGGAIGSVAPRHITFSGSTTELSTLVVDTGPQAAAILREDAVDVVLLTPV